MCGKWENAGRRPFEGGGFGAGMGVEIGAIT